MVKLAMESVVPSSQMRGESASGTGDLRRMLAEDERYITGFQWCKGVVASYFGLGVGGIVGVFLFQIRPNGTLAEEWVWVVVGDLPLAYISTFDCPNPATALDTYVGAMTDWVEAARAGVDVSELIPANVPPTAEFANSLEKRLHFIDEHILTLLRHVFSEMGWILGFSEREQSNRHLRNPVPEPPSRQPSADLAK